MSNITNDLIERTNKLFEKIKNDPEFQYTSEDYDEKNIIIGINKGPEDEEDDEKNNIIKLIFTVTKVKVIKNVNITKNLIVYPYFLDYLPMRLIDNDVKIKYIVDDHEVKRDEINMMLFDKESINDNKNIKFVFPKNCISNIPNKLYINEFGREIIHLSIHYIHSKVLDLLLNSCLIDEKKLQLSDQDNNQDNNQEKNQDNNQEKNQEENQIIESKSKRKYTKKK